MDNLNFDNGKIKLIQENNLDEILLIDFNDFKSNLSSKLLIGLNDEQSIYRKYIDIMSEIQEEIDYNSILFKLTLILKKFINTNKPVKMLEVGSLDGYMSKYFANLLKYFNEENKLVCIDLFNQQVENKGIFKFTNSFELYKNNINSSGAVDIVNTVIGNPIDMLEIIEDDTFDIIFVHNKYSDCIYLNKYINKIKDRGLIILDLSQDVQKLNSYVDNSFDTFIKFTDLDNILTGYSTINKSEKSFFKLESIKTQYKNVYKNILEMTGNVVKIIDNITTNLDDDNKEKIEYTINLLSMIEDVLIEINNELINNDLKFYTNEVKNSLMDLMIEIERNGKFINRFKSDLIENKQIWYESIQEEFLDK